MFYIVFPEIPGTISPHAWEPSDVTIFGDVTAAVAGRRGLLVQQPTPRHRTLGRLLGRQAWPVPLVTIST